MESIVYTKTEIDKVRAGVEALKKKNQEDMNIEGLYGNMALGYLSALNDVCFLFLDMDIQKLGEITKAIQKDVETIEKALGVCSARVAG